MAQDSAREAARPRLLPSRGTDAPRSLRASVLSFATVGDHGDLLVSYLRSRKTTFIDRLNWNLSEADGMEFDQYDTPQCRWVILHEFGEILGGVRLLPTTAACGIYTYMLRDAQRGLIESIPSDVLFLDAPTLPMVWEASRLFISETVPAHRRHDVQALLMQTLARTAHEAQARYVIGIVPWVFSRWLRRLGLAALPVGPRFNIDSITSQAALFNVSRYID
ncbi:MAG: acyl-homoserine-lactone synthase [Pseudomonadota bacterium]